MNGNKEIQEKCERIFGMVLLTADNITITIYNLYYCFPQFLCHGVILVTPHHGTSTFFFFSLISHCEYLLVRMALYNSNSHRLRMSSRPRIQVLS